MICPRRAEHGIAGNHPFTFLPKEDEWRPDGTCSFCGSIAPEAFFQAVDEGKEIGPTDKSYKLYVESSQFSKFYMQHFSQDDRTKFIELVNGKKIKFGYPGYLYTTPFFCERVSSGSDL